MAKSNASKTDEGGEANTAGIPYTLQTLLEHAKSVSRSEPQDAYARGRRDALMELYTSGGLPTAQLGLELLYLLPDSFTTFYAQLWDKAMTGHGESRKGEGVVKSQGNTGTVLGSDTRLQAQAGGKKYRVPAGNIGSEKALTIKTEVDRQLLELVRGGRAALFDPRSKEDIQNKPLQCQGIVRGGLEGRAAKRCTRFLKKGWKFCPECGWEVGV